MYIEIKTNEELNDFKIIVEILDYEIIDELSLGYFYFKEGKVFKIENTIDRNYFIPSSVLEKIVNMANLILKDRAAFNEAKELNDFSLCLSKEETNKAEEYLLIFENDFHVWSSMVIDRLYHKKMLNMENENVWN